MADKVHVDSRKVENYVRKKAYPEEILCDKVKKANFRKRAEKFSVRNGHLIDEEKRYVVFEKEHPQLITHDAHEGLGYHPKAKASSSHGGRKATNQKMYARFY